MIRNWLTSDQRSWLQTQRFDIDKHEDHDLMRERICFDWLWCITTFVEKRSSCEDRYFLMGGGVYHTYTHTVIGIGPEVYTRELLCKLISKMVNSSELYYVRYVCYDSKLHGSRYILWWALRDYYYRHTLVYSSDLSGSDNTCDEIFVARRRYYARRW